MFVKIGNTVVNKALVAYVELNAVDKGSSIIGVRITFSFLKSNKPATLFFVGNDAEIAQEHFTNCL